MGLELVLALLVVALAVVAQAGTGSGFGIIAAPLLLMVNPDLIPGPLLMITILVMAVVALQNRQGLKHFDLSITVVGALPAAVLGIWLLPLLDVRLGDLLVGFVVVLAALAGLFGWKIRQSKKSLLVAGVVSGLLSSVFATPGPPVVLAYRAVDVTRYRANLAVFFLSVSLLSFIGLVAVGSFGNREFELALWLIPGVLVGAIMSFPIVKLIPQNLVRPLALLMCLSSGLGLIARWAIY